MHRSFAILVLLSLASPEYALTQPSGRACHSSAATSEGVVIWGGAAACGVGVVNDSSLWLWNGMQWRSVPGPPLVPREDALLLYSPTDSSMTLLGGRRDGVAYADLWRFDGKAWHEVSAQGGPGPIQHGAAAYDPVRKRVVVFGGAVGRTFSGKTYEWDGVRWHEFDVPGPAPRVGHGMAWSQAAGGVLLYGGFAESQFRDLWKWNGAQWERLATDGPTFTEGHVVAEADRGVYIVGPGLEKAATVRVWRWYDGRFTELSEAGPALRTGATATYDRARNVLLYWGGSSGGEGPSSVIYEFDGTRWHMPSRE